jgi:omega-amidase
MKKFRLAMVQMAVTESKSVNLQSARTHVMNAAKNGAQLVILPECFNSPYGPHHFPNYAEPITDGETSQMLSNVAREANVFLVGGSFPETKDQRYYNTCTVWSPSGHHLGTHRKLHLFDISIPNAITFRESETLTAGSEMTLVDLVDQRWSLGFRIGLGICYDLRFPELAMMAARQGAAMMIYPGAFNTTTGPRHWKLLLRARALDQQIFTVGVSPARFHPDSPSFQGECKVEEEERMKKAGVYMAWGHSMVVGPDGTVLQEMDEMQSTSMVDVDLDAIETIKQQIPVSSQRRFDVYPDISAKAMTK